MNNRRNSATLLPGPPPELRIELARKIAFSIGTAEKQITAIPGLTLTRRTRPMAPASGTYEPSLAVVAQGRKRVDLGRTTFIFDESRFLLTSLDLPIIGQVIEASEQEPFLCLMLKLEMSVVRALLSREEIPVMEVPSDSPAMATGDITAELLGACCRLLDLLNCPQDIPFLSGLIQREIIYRILQTPAGVSPSGNCNVRRSEPAYGKSDRVDQGELREAATGRRSRTTRRHGCIHTPQSFSSVDGNESTSVPKAVEVAGRTGQNAHRWAGRRNGSLRGRVRKCEPIQPRIQPFLRPTTNAGYPNSSLG